jgi:hypothetical protein
MRLPLDAPLIQVAGIRDRAEADLVQECGVRYLGFPLVFLISGAGRPWAIAQDRKLDDRPAGPPVLNRWTEPLL